jgi:tetratricopeptide (TPR) repeat protein
MPPSKQEFVVVIPQFEGITDEATKEAVNIRDRIVTELLSRQKNHRLKLRIVLRHEKLDPVFNKTEALVLGKHYGAHLVLSGKVRLDEQFYFEPVMLTLLKLKSPYEPFNLIDRLVVTAPFSTVDLLRLKEKKVRDIGEVVVLILGLALYEQNKYEEAVSVFESVGEPSSQASLMIGNCYSQMGQLDKGLQYYRSVSMKMRHFHAIFSVRPRHFPMTVC